MLPPHRLALALLVLPIAAALASCGAGSTSDSKSESSSAASAGDAPRSPGGGAVTADQAGGAAAAKPAADAAVQRAVIATAGLRLTTHDLAGVRQDAINEVSGLGGHVADEQSLSDARGRLDRVDLTVRVPAASFEQALDRLAALGTVWHRQQSVEDVTTQVIDIRARVKAQSASVASIEQLLARASTIGEIMSIEHELATRQADLDSLKQQQKYLADQTSMSTIQLTLTRPPVRHGVAHAGFVGGLASGWHALGRTAVALGTVVGAALPFVALLGLVGWPVAVLVRRRRATGSPPPPVEA